MKKRPVPPVQDDELSRLAQKANLGPVMAVASSGIRMIGEGSTPHEARCNPILYTFSDMPHDEDAVIDFVACALNRLGNQSVGGK
jgi:hypothetical protein